MDATPLFVVLFVEAMNWLGASAVRSYTTTLCQPCWRLWIGWIDSAILTETDTLSTAAAERAGYTTKGWKDSATSLQNPDGTLAALPAALVEVQGYVYQAKAGLALIAQARGDAELSRRLNSEAEVLKHRFNHDFWMEDEGFFAQALDGAKRPVRAITSNVGHALVGNRR